SWQAGNTAIALSDGGFLVFWQSLGQDGPDGSYGVYGQRYNADGAVHGGEFRVNTFTAGSQYAPSAALLDNGGFVVTWNSNLQDGSTRSIYGQRFNADGTVHGSEFKINSYDTGIQEEPTVKGLDNGGFVVTWNSYGQDGDGSGIYGQRFDKYAVADGSEFRVNTYTSDDQLNSDITTLDDGGFMVAWTSTGQDGSGKSVHGQRFAADGSYSGDEFIFNSTTANDQSSVALAALDHDDVVAVWQSDGQDGSGQGIFSKIVSLSNDPRFTQGDDTATLLDSGETINALDGKDTVTGGSGNDIISGNGGNDILKDDGGHDRLYGGDGQDNLQGGDGNDILDGGSGQDWMFGGPGDDTYYVDETLDYIDEGVAFPTLPGGGTDSLISTAAWYYESNFTIENLTIAEGAQTDGGITTLVGGGFDNVIHGNSGNNNIYANWGNDTVYAGAGTDHIDLSDRPGGATGANTVMFEVGNGYDILWNFAPGTDHVDLKPFGLADYAALAALGHDDGLGNSYFALGPTGTDYLYFVGHTLADLGAGDFVFS
ncbi:MAG TPA: calcium-binding protein, partial [Rhodobacteraceae bacterium]|nr:calcium-binding protein [Paracoccaceae bacterium]